MSKELCFHTATPDEIAMLSQHGDSEAFHRLWESTIPTIERIAGHFHARYPWIEQEDITQAVLLKVPKILRRFDSEKATKGVLRYFYFSFYRAAQDFLRCQDPLGVRIPHKTHYPAFTHLEDLCPRDATPRFPGDEIIAKGLNNMDRGYLPDLGDGR